MGLNFQLKLFSIPILLIFAQGILLADTLDHKVFIREINNSNALVYNTCLEKYNEYLKAHPDDVWIHIEKCKFIQFAQYDEEEDYNPNQEAFDSCTSVVIKLFPTDPGVYLFRISYLWGDELKQVLDEAETDIEAYPDKWSGIASGVIYEKLSSHYYNESDFPSALNYMEKAILRDTFYKTSLEYARILIESGKKAEALEVLHAGPDTTKMTWELSQKADLYLELKDFDSALILYNHIDEIDSTYNNNVKIANTLEGVGEYLSARKYLIADTSVSWNKMNALKKLLHHDLKYQRGDQGLATYNSFRDHGYATDPLGIYRLQLLFSHPFETWKLRDILGLITLKATLLLLIIIPFIWILPIYFIGHHLNLFTGPKPYALNWGLKAFWFLSAGYLVSSFVAYWIEPEYLYSLFMDSYNSFEITQEKEGKTSILYILLFALFGFATLYKINPKILLSDQWPIIQCVLYSIGFFIVYKLLFGIYALMMVSCFGLTMEDLAGVISNFLASREDIKAIIAVGGKGIGFLLICLLVPVYEELIFRGVILDAGQRYLNFNTANFIQAVLFATIHMNLYLFPVFLMFGLLTGYMRRQSGGLFGGIIFHVINNILALSVLLIRDI